MRKSISIFGSTGNLMYKKLFPALNKLIEDGHLDATTKIYCIARKDCTLKDYIEDAKKYVTGKMNWDNIIPHLTYVLFDIDDIEDYKKLEKRILEDGITDSMFYLAVPPTLFPSIAKGISESGLVQKGNLDSRIVFEKPFGENLETAKSINRDLWTYFDENQIYRIDHYLGKEMTQNILVVRFANTVFSQAWNNNSIKSITIIAKEKEGVMSRGGYYDNVGALNDMFQSHLLQMASLATMENPKTYDSEDIKNEKVNLIKQITIQPKDVILGQYKGYQDEEQVKPNSKTETFVFLKAEINNKRWKGVPIYFLTGKMLNEKRSEIIIRFEDDENLKRLWPDAPKNNSKLVIKVAPEEGVLFQFNVKEPGLRQNLVPAVLDYCHSCKATGNTPEAYEKLLLDLINKNRTLFTRWDEIESSWETVENLKAKLHNPIIYNSFSELKEIIRLSGVGEVNDL